MQPKIADGHWQGTQRFIAGMKRRLNWKQLPVVGLVSYLRWTIPIAVSFVGIVYMLIEDVVFQGRSVTDVSVIRGVLVIGLAGPALVWLTLTWAAHAAMAEAQAQKELSVLSQAARSRAARLQIASWIGQQMTTILDLNTLFEQAVQLICTKLGYHHAHLFIVEKETGQIVLKEAYGLYADLIKARGLKLEIGGQGIVGWVAQTGETRVSNDIRKETRYHNAELLPKTQAELSVPLKFGNQVVGVLDVQSNRPNTFDKEDITVLTILGNQIGIAIANARLFEETKHRYEAMMALHAVSLDTIAQLDMASLLEALLRRGTNLLGAQAGALFLYDEQMGLARNIANYNTWRDWTGTTLHLGEGIAGQVILTGEPLIVNDYENWEGKSRVFANDPQSRVVGAPIQHGSKAIGAILVLNEQHSRPFDADDLWLMRQFADLASIAIENAKLHTQVKNFSRDLESQVDARTRELSTAKEEIAAQATQLRSLLSKTITIQEEERSRIARDLHDSVVQLITSARYELKAARVVGAAELSNAASKKLDAAREVLDEAEKEIRNAIYDLHSPVLEVVGVVPALQKYANRLQELAGINCEIAVRGGARRLAKAIEVAVFYMVEEALHNISVHSDAANAAVLFDFAPRLLQVTVLDDGRGFDYPLWIEHQNGDHLGLIGMQERTKSLGGEMTIWSAIGKGTRLDFRLPLEDSAAASLENI